MKAYAGIGSRETPDDVLEVMEQIGFRLADAQWALRTGGAEGADNAFAEGHVAAVGYDGLEVYLPWRGFNNWGDDDDDGIARCDPQPEAFELSGCFHPSWDSLSDGARKLHARNAHQVLGYDVSAPALSRFVICWTPNASGSGGTGQALRIAEAYSVPVFDLADADVTARLNLWLDSMEGA